MAVLTPPMALGAAGQILSGRLLRHNLGAFALPAAGVAVRSGVLAGPAGTQGELALPNASNLTVQPFHAVVQNTQDLTAGAYTVTNDAAVTLAVTAQHATQFRRSLVVIEVNDSQTAGVASSATTDRVRLYLSDGALAASSGAAVLPALPANALALGELLIPPTGQTVTLTPYDARTVLRGSRLPVATEAAAAALPTALLYLGFEVAADDTQAVGRWDGTRFVWFDTRWQTYTPTVTVNNTGITQGNGPLLGKFFRSGHQITVDFFFQVGTTTSFGGAAGIIRFDTPVGYRPSPTVGSLTVFGNYNGTGRVSGASGFMDLFCVTEQAASAASRRMLMATAADLAIQSSGGTVNPINAVNHFLQGHITYNTDFEA